MHAVVRPKPGEQTLEQMKAKYSLAPVAAALEALLGDAFVGLAPDCIGEAVETRIEGLKPGQVCAVPENSSYNTASHLLVGTASQ